MKKIYFHILAVAIVGLIAYSNSFSVPFQFDDVKVIEENPFIKNIDNFTSLESRALTPRDEYNPRRYLGYLSLALNYRYGGLEVTGYHIVNFLIHLLTAILVYFFVILTFRTPYFRGSATGDPGSGTGDRSLVSNHQFRVPELIALFSALLFVAHPVQTQAVTYIVQRFTSLATLFYLASVVFYVKGRLAMVKKGKSDVSSETAGNSRFTIYNSRFAIVWYLLSLVSAVCAMKTKEIAFTLPIMIVLYEFIFFKTTLKRKLVFLVPILLTLVIVPMSVLNTNKPLGDILSDLSEKSRLQTNMPRVDYLMTEMRVIVTYIRLIFLPVKQNLDYDYPIYRSFSNPQVFLSFLLLSALFGTAVYLLYKSRPEVSSKKLVLSSEKEEIENRPETDAPSLLTVHYSLFTGSAFHVYRLIAFGILWFFVTLSVESSFIPIVDVIFEHRLYLPSAGAFIALSAALFTVAMKVKNRWPRAEKAAVPAALIIVLMLSAATFARNRVWQDKTRLWTDMVMKSPRNARAHNNLGFLYNEKGMNDQAIEQLVTALRLRPSYLDARVNLGIAYNAKGMYDEAIENFLIALSMNPDDPDAHNNLGIAYVSKGRYDEGITQYQIAIKIWPDYAEAYNNLGVAYASKGASAEAIRYFEQAIRLKADYFEANYNLALLFDKMGDREKALEQYKKADDMKTTEPSP